jgi:hypothetical protein
MRQKAEVRRQKTEGGRRAGSAIILAIVLTTLLAIIGVLFLISSRVDSIATSSIADNEDLTLAVDSVIAQISQVLTADIINSGDPNCYADYPDPCNYWLASLEPNDSIIWPHITDIYNRLGDFAYLPVDGVLHDHSDTAGDSMPGNLYRADADGDGAPDAVWVRIQSINSSKGKPIFAAIRIIDNGGMLNVNTGFKFDPLSSVGSKQADINVMALSWRQVGGSYDPAREASLLAYRNPQNHPSYEKDVVWRYDSPDCNYTPFDISDELDMRYRFLIDQNDIRTRLESWSGEFARWDVHDVPFDTSNYRHGAGVPKNWFTHACYTVSSEPNYTYRHITTTYNCDRIITPAGNKMININNPALNPADVCDAVRAALIEGGMPIADADSNAAQIAVNLIDYVDADSIVSSIIDGSSIIHFGFEQPCVYISEIAQNFFQPDPGDPTVVNHSYAIEIYKPYTGDELPNDPNWQLVIDGRNIAVKWSGSDAFHVFVDNTNASGNSIIPVFKDANGFDNTTAVPQTPEVGESFSFDRGNVIELRRRAFDPSLGIDVWITVDRVQVPDAGTGIYWLIPQTTAATYTFQRDINPHKPIRRLWDLGLSKISPDTLGFMNNYDDSLVSGDNRKIQAHPANTSFTNVGEIGQLFRRSTYDYGGTGPFPGILEEDMRLNLADPNYRWIFKYITVDNMDPTWHGRPKEETRVKGRININTAPWFVIAQLPWMSYRDYDTARSIVNKREMRGGYKSIGELMADANNSADNIGYYGDMSKTVPPVLMTPNDPPNDDIFEKRDVIFARISNLVTVRSDVFTAYILVRIGPDGPQKRVIAILDRSAVTPAGGKVKIVAIQNVPDPR